MTIDALNEVCEANGFNVDIPWKDLTEEQKNVVLNGSDKIKIPTENIRWSRGCAGRHYCQNRGRRLLQG
ncbi:MAG: hypothetical protein R2759_02270 [Bacteroidales bacterium]